MKTAKHIVGFFAAVSGIAANIGAWHARSLLVYTDGVYFDDLTTSWIVHTWFTLLSILLWVVFLILLVIPTKKPSVKVKK